MASGLPNAIQMALDVFNDEICAYERGTLKCYTLVLVPHNPVEPVAVSLNGKPAEVEAERAIEVAMLERGDAPDVATRKRMVLEEARER